MTRYDLKIGYGVVLRNGDRGIVAPYSNCLTGIYFYDNTWLDIMEYHNDLTCYNRHSYDIVKVYGFPRSCSDFMTEQFEHRRNLLWEEPINKPIADTAEDILMYGMEILSDD